MNKWNELFFYILGVHVLILLCAYQLQLSYFETSLKWGQSMPLRPSAMLSHHEPSSGKWLSGSVLSISRVLLVCSSRGICLITVKGIASGFKAQDVHCGIREGCKDPRSAKDPRSVKERFLQLDKSLIIIWLLNHPRRCLLVIFLVFFFFFSCVNATL